MIYALSLGAAESSLISSITSTNIRRITFTQSLAEGQEIPDRSDWAKLDKALCQLVDRLECGFQLEVEFQDLNTEAWWSGGLGFKEYLPRFCEKGGVDGGRGK